ncbi:MAG TPA: hypothetical protein VMV10_17945 [Pirellulales bacterium]|nr:hypothetical protein [Pirellulales bacterium]
MPYPHVMRLRGPWEFEVLRSAAADSPGRSAPAGLSGRVRAPCDWSQSLGLGFRGAVRYRRRFNRPSGLDPHERVWLVVEGVDAFGAAMLNGRALGQAPGYALPASFDVTEWLSPSNELFIDVELPDELPGGSAALRPGRETLAGGLIGEVRLEVRAGAFIERLAIWTTRETDAAVLQARGQIGGNAASPLAVVVNGAERELLYGEVRPGRTFELSGALEPLLASAELSLEIKLLAGGVALWQTDRRLAMAEGPTPSTVETLRQILPEATYAEFDRAGRTIAQAVPVAWADEVCPRLAHHRSIVAWAASAAELAQAGDERLSRLAFGRPWVKA